MEKAVELCEVITQGKELAEQLMNHHLNPSSSSSSSSPPRETTELLLENLLASYDKAISMLNSAALAGESLQVLANISPKSIVSDPGPKGQFSRDVNKKRKTQQRTTEQVKVCSGTPDDEYSWRKYGQKDILGTNYPRGYYRCTHRHSHGCLALKQVQKSDNDHTIYEVTYKDRHTCGQAESHLPQIDQSIEKNPTPKPIKNLGDGPNNVIKTEDLGSREDIFQPFSFPPAASSGGDHGNDLFLFPGSPYHMNNYGMAIHGYTSESDLTEVVSAHNSVTNSPIGDGFEIVIDDTLDFDQLFELENNNQDL